MEPEKIQNIAPNQEQRDAVLKILGQSIPEPAQDGIGKNSEVGADTEPENKAAELIDALEPEKTEDEHVEILENKTHDEKKTPFQKRIDKLTAEKKSALEENQRLKEQIKQLEQKKPDVESESKETDVITVEIEGKKFDEKTLLKARDYYSNPDNFDQSLLNVINDALIDIRVIKARNEFTQPSKEEVEKKKFIEQENSLWNAFKESNKSDDKDLDFNNSKSLAFTVLTELYKRNPAKYDTFGANRFIVAGYEAKELILRSRLDKTTETKTKTLEDKLAKEKRKTQLGIPSSSVSSDVGAPETPSYADDFAEIQKQRNRLRGG